MTYLLIKYRRNNLAVVVKQTMRLDINRHLFRRSSSFDSLAFSTILVSTNSARPPSKQSLLTLARLRLTLGRCYLEMK